MKIQVPYLKSSRLLVVLLPLLFILLHFVDCTRPPPHTRWSLPEGVKACFNKGSIIEIAHSSDSTVLLQHLTRE